MAIRLRQLNDLTWSGLDACLLEGFRAGARPLVARVLGRLPAFCDMQFRNNHSIHCPNPQAQRRPTFRVNSGDGSSMVRHSTARPVKKAEGRREGILDFLTVKAAFQSSN